MLCGHPPAAYIKPPPPATAENITDGPPSWTCQPVRTGGCANMVGNRSPAILLRHSANKHLKQTNQRNSVFTIF